MGMRTHSAAVSMPVRNTFSAWSWPEAYRKGMKSTQQTSAARIGYIDIFKAIGIILMVMGHVGFGEMFDKVIHAFHMPMFFFASGFLHKERTTGIRTLVRIKAKKLLIPYFVFGGMCCLLDGRINGISSEPWRNLLWANTTYIPIAGAVWFLSALFFTEIAYCVLTKYKWRLMIFPIALFGCLAEKLLPYPLPWALGASCVGLGLYWVGHETRKREASLKHLLNMPLGLCLILCMLDGWLILTNGYINMRAEKYANIPLFWLNALLSIYIGISLSKIIQSALKDTFIEKWLISVGRDSIVYVCCNQLVIYFVAALFKHVGIADACEDVLILIVSMIILYGLSVLFTRTKLRFLIGK
ncbi:MAG TPA: hypothetical protein DFH97_08065 [Clostridiales bacterium]|nr:hypothetical protein [Clostridiales bacterium]